MFLPFFMGKRWAEVVLGGTKWRGNLKNRSIMEEITALRS